MQMNHGVGCPCDSWPEKKQRPPPHDDNRSYGGFSWNISFHTPNRIGQLRYVSWYKLGHAKRVPDSMMSTGRMGLRSCLCLLTHFACFQIHTCFVLVIRPSQESRLSIWRVRAPRYIGSIIPKCWIVIMNDREDNEIPEGGFPTSSAGFRISSAGLSPGLIGWSALYHNLLCLLCCP